MKKLYCVNLEGNPIAEKCEKGVPFRLYVGAFLPHIKYYNYRLVTDVERQEGRECFK